jgi:hypothetical protein
MQAMPTAALLQHYCPGYWAGVDVQGMFQAADWLLVMFKMNGNGLAGAILAGLSLRKERSMKTWQIQVRTNNLSGYLRLVHGVLRTRGHGGEMLEPDQYVFTGLTTEQFRALEDTAAWLNLYYEGQEERGRR